MTTDPNSASHAEPAPDSAQPDRAARAGAGRSAPVEADYDREQVKQQALDLVAKIRRDTGRLQGSATTAARQLGLDPRTVRNWIRYVDLAEPTDTKAAGGPDDPEAASRRAWPLVPVLHCTLCRRPMHTAHPPAGEPVYRCQADCRRRRPIPALLIEDLIGRTLQLRAPRAVRTHTPAATPVQAAAVAPLTLRRIFVGHTVTDLRLVWR